MIEKYTQPSAYFPDFDHGSSVLAATNPGGLLLVILILIRFAKSWRGIVGVPCGMKVRREGMVAVVKVFRLQRRMRLGRSVRSFGSAIIRVCTGGFEEGWMRKWYWWIDGCFTGERMLVWSVSGYISLRRLPPGSMSFYDGVSS